MKDNQNSELWSIVEDSFRPENHFEAESVFALGNGQIMQRANFEEFYSGESEFGSYILANNALSDALTDQQIKLPNCIKINVRLNTELIDLASCEVITYRRELNMQKGYLERTFEIITPENHHVELSVQRFLSLSQPELLAIKYFVRSHNFDGKISFIPVIDGDFNLVYNTQQEPEWNVLQSKTQLDVCHLWVQMRRTNFQVCEAIAFDFLKNNSLVKNNPTKIEKQKVAGFSLGVDVKAGESVAINKYVSILNSSNHPYQELTARACDKVLDAKRLGLNELFEENCRAWEQMWDNVSVELSKDNIVREFKKYQSKSL